MKLLVEGLKTVGNSFLDLIYPPLCFHCHAHLETGSLMFCRYCQSFLEIIDPQYRCPICFSADFNPSIKRGCNECQKTSKHIKHRAAVFEYEGPSTTLIKGLKYGGKAFLAKVGGAYLATQFLALNWPMPDLIVPMPMSRLKKIQRGYNQSELLAEALAKFISCPISHGLKRHGGDFSQAGLTHEQRLQLKSDSFFVKNQEQFHDKTLLIIDDVMTTGSSLNCCAEALLPCFPKEIYALTLCLAM
jgi:competence protein ComFC